MSAILSEFQASLERYPGRFLEQEKPFGKRRIALANDYLHMHLNRLALFQGEETAFRKLRAQIALDTMQATPAPTETRGAV